MKHKILFTADIHGNKIQYGKLVNYAIKISADSIIIGGDIAPKDVSIDLFINSQRKFFEEELPTILKPLKTKLPNSKLFLMMGNDDCSINRDVLEKNDPYLYQIIHGKRIKLTKDFELVGYSYVPITPFGIKDWEKFDLYDVPDEMAAEYMHRINTNYGFVGLKSTKQGWKEFIFTPDDFVRDSIQKEFEDTLFTQNPEKNSLRYTCPSQ